MKIKSPTIAARVQNPLSKFKNTFSKNNAQGHQNIRRQQPVINPSSSEETFKKENKQNAYIIISCRRKQHLQADKQYNDNKNNTLQETTFISHFTRDMKKQDIKQYQINKIKILDRLFALEQQLSVSNCFDGMQSSQTRL